MKTITELNNNCEFYTRELNETINFKKDGKTFKVLILKIYKKGTKRVFFAPYTTDLKKVSKVFFARKHDALNVAREYAQYKMNQQKEETTELLTKSIKLRKEVLKYTCGNQSQPQLLTTMPVIEMLDKFDNKVITKNKEFIKMYLNLFNDYSTLKLRELCKIVGYDYWSGLNNSNRIDTLDSVFANFKY